MPDVPRIRDWAYETARHCRTCVSDLRQHEACCFLSVRLSVCLSVCLSLSLCKCLSQLVTSQCTATLLQTPMLILINFRCWSPFAIARSAMYLHAAVPIADWSQHPSWLANQVNDMWRHRLRVSSACAADHAPAAAAAALLAASNIHITSHYVLVVDCMRCVSSRLTRSVSVVYKLLFNSIYVNYYIIQITFIRPTCILSTAIYGCWGIKYKIQAYTPSCTCPSYCGLITFLPLTGDLFKTYNT